MRVKVCYKHFSNVFKDIFLKVVKTLEMSAKSINPGQQVQAGLSQNILLLLNGPPTQG